MSKEKMDMAKVMAVLAQPQEKPEPLENVEQRRLEIPFITKNGCVRMRPIRLYIPNTAQIPMPLVYVPHYEMAEDALELRDYLGKGWMVASPTDFENTYNGQLTDDDLIFNNAAVYKLKELPEVDTDKIALVGGSAGGYMTLMLNATKLGICCSIANSPVTNLYFNFYEFFRSANQLNVEALAKSDATEKAAKPKTPMEVMQSVMNLPIPFLAAVCGMFLPNLDNFPDKEDIKRWEAFSPVALTELFVNPLMVNHFTSDILVPVDQISRRYTYEKPGESLPVDFSSRMSKESPGRLKNSLEDGLPKEELRIERLDVEETEAKGVFPFDDKKCFNLNIFDDGPTEGYGSHRAKPSTGRVIDTPYLEAMFAKGAAKTNMLTQEKLKFLLKQYQGKTVQLPAHEQIDDTVYGSLSVYREEVVKELQKWVKDHEISALESTFTQTILLVEEIEKAAYTEAMQEIQKNF